MAVADSWEHTWRSGMIVSGAEDEEELEGEMAPRLGMRLGLLVIVGLVAVGAITTRVRLTVLQAEQRRLLDEIADMQTENELLRCEVAERSGPAVISAYASEKGLRPPASIAEIGPPATVGTDGGEESGGVAAQVRQRSEEAVRNTARRLRDILRGPDKGR